MTDSVPDNECSDPKPTDEEVAAMKKIIATDGGTQFTQICLYNSLHKNRGVEEGIIRLVDIYSNLMALHGFMSGFQYVALDTEVNNEEEGDEVWLQNLIFVLRYLGFVVSLGGTLICVVIQEFLKTIEDEATVAQIRGILKYQLFIQLGDISAIVAVAILAITSNLILYTKPLSTTYCIVLNAICGFFVILFLRAFYVILLRRQSTGRHIYKDPDFQETQASLKKQCMAARLLKKMDVRNSFMM